MIKYLVLLRFKAVFSSVQSFSCVWLFATPWTAAHQAYLYFTKSWSLLKLMSWVSDAIQPSHPSSVVPFSSCFQSVPATGSFPMSHLYTSGIVSFSFSISTFSEYSGLISFRVDWFDLLAVQGTLKGLLQHRSSKASILRRLAFFIVQLSHPYMTTGKTIALTKTLLAK